VIGRTGSVSEGSEARALAIRERVLGSEHPNVALCLENYALLLRKMNRAEATELMEARARAIWTKRGLIRNPEGRLGYSRELGSYF
jgi:hypothetical protein